MRNSNYDIPLDFAMLSRYIAEFTTDNITFFMSIDSLIEKYNRMHGKNPTYDEAHEIPIGINTKTKEVVVMNLNDSYTNTILSHFDYEETKAAKE